MLVSLLGALALAGSGMALAADAVVTYQTNGIGVAGATPGGQVPEQINHDAITGLTEAIAVDFGAEAVLARVEVSNLFPTEGSGERGKWEAFDGLGKPVGEAVFELVETSAGFIPDIDSTNIEGPFRYLVFTALPYATPEGNDSSDYFIRSIQYTINEADATPVTIGGLSSGEADWASLKPLAFNLGTPYTRSDGAFIDAEIIIDTANCSGDGDNNGGCVVPFTADFQLVVKDAPDVTGSLAANVQTIVDPRASCGNTTDEASTATTLDLGFDLGDGETGPDIPAHLCGTPNPLYANQPTFTLVNVDSQLTVVRSVLELVSDNTTNPAYFCLAADKDKRPVIAGLPKTANAEIPVLDGDGNLVTVVQDGTYACGSSRSGRSLLSFLIYDLHHVEGADYVAITSSAITRLNTTVLQSGACIDKLQLKAVTSRAKSATQGFDRGDYSTAKRQLIELLYTVSNDIAYDQCLFDLDNNNVIPGAGFDFEDLPDNLVPRNFRGDLIVQIRHILYMIERMLDEPKPALPQF